MNFRENAITSTEIVKADYFINIKTSALSFINTFFVIKNKLFRMPLIKLCKLRLVNNKLAPNITHMTLVKLAIKNHVEDL